MTDDEISPWGGICVWQGTGDFWLLGGLLDCFWYKWQAVLLHTDRSSSE